MSSLNDSCFFPVDFSSDNLNLCFDILDGYCILSGSQPDTFIQVNTLLLLFTHMFTLFTTFCNSVACYINLQFCCLYSVYTRLLFFYYLLLSLFTELCCFYYLFVVVYRAVRRL